MMKLIRVGFYRELEHTPSNPSTTPSIVDAIHEIPQENEAKIAAYLSNGICLGAGGCYVDDVLDPFDRTPLNEHLYTDGTYLWRIDIAHYVEKYHLRLDEPFIMHMRSKDWQPPTRKDINMDDLDW